MTMGMDHPLEDAGERERSRHRETVWSKPQLQAGEVAFSEDMESSSEPNLDSDDHQDDYVSDWRDLDLSIWVECVAFVGPGHHLPISLSCWKLRQAYRVTFADKARITSLPLLLSFPSLIDWIVEERYPLCKRSLSCPSSTSLEVVERRPENTPDPLGCVKAASSGQIDLVQQARDERSPWDERVCSAAAAQGNLSMLRWARSAGCPWSETTCSAAAAKGHLHVLRWARANGCPWTATTCSAAAAGGHLHVLRWARHEGCPWDATTCIVAAAINQPEILKWAVVNGCQWDPTTFSIWRPTFKMP